MSIEQDSICYYIRNKLLMRGLMLQDVSELLTNFSQDPSQPRMDKILEKKQSDYPQRDLLRIEKIFMDYAKKWVHRNRPNMYYAKYF